MAPKQSKHVINKQQKGDTGGQPPGGSPSKRSPGKGSPSTRDTRKVIRVGSDFAGIGTMTIAMSSIMSDLNSAVEGIGRWEHTFSCDKDPVCESLIKHGADAPHLYYRDCLTRPACNQLPKVDVYSFSAPCTTFSTLGHRAGVEGDGVLGMSSLVYIQHHRPALVVSENVASITFEKNRLCTTTTKLLLLLLLLLLLYHHY